MSLPLSQGGQRRATQLAGCLFKDDCKGSGGISGERPKDCIRRRGRRGHHGFLSFVSFVTVVSFLPFVSFVSFISFFCFFLLFLVHPSFLPVSFISKIPTMFPRPIPWRSRVTKIGVINTSGGWVSYLFISFFFHHQPAPPPSPSFFPSFPSFPSFLSFVSFISFFCFFLFFLLHPPFLPPFPSSSLSPPFLPRYLPSVPL